ncbi:MAG: ASKHA domain-containing protein [Planctomycetota bacterium]
MTATSPPASLEPAAGDPDALPLVRFVLPGANVIEGRLLPNESVAHAAVRLGIDLRMSCGGHETCSSCQMTRDGRALRSCQERTGGTFEIQRIALHDTAVQIISDAEVEPGGPADPILVGVELRPIPAQFSTRYAARLASLAGPTGPVGADTAATAAPPAATAPTSPAALPAASPAAEDDIGRLRQALAAAGWPHVEIPFGLAADISRLMAPRTGVFLPTHLYATLCRTTLPPRLVGLNASSAEAPLYAAAVDLGTTTVVAELVDCRSGEVLATASAGNAQVRLAEDVAARISVARDRLPELHALVIKRTLQPLVEKIAATAQIPTTRIGAMVVSGNTVMTHLMLGWPTDGLGHVPFNPVSLTPPPVDATQVGLKMHPHAQLIAVPSLSGYVGGDLVSGLLVTGLAEKSQTTALIDVGTNAEILLSHRGKIYGTSTPAGPSFEGGGIRWGVRASTGAIEHIRITADGLSIQTIGNAAPVGICGSGLVDLLAEGLRCGLLNAAGRFQTDHPNLEWSPPPAAAGTVPTPSNRAQRRRLVVADAATARAGCGAIYVSEVEISQLLQAKAAIFSGFYTLLQAVGLDLRDVHELLLAGGFARHIDLNSAVGCGLLPDLPNICVVGNTSLAGALRCMLDHRLRAEAERFSRNADIVELNLEPTFEQNFIDALFLPNVRKKLFPSVKVPPPVRRSPPLPSLPSHPLPAQPLTESGDGAVQAQHTDSTQPRTFPTPSPVPSPAVSATAGITSGGPPA